LTKGTIKDGSESSGLAAGSGDGISVEAGNSVGGLETVEMEMGEAQAERKRSAEIIKTFVRNGYCFILNLPEKCSDCVLAAITASHISL
jgi:hypothetical protein